MLGKLLNRLLGFDRIKQRADRLFLEADYTQALREYRRARTALGSGDYRVATVESLIQECAGRAGAPTAASELSSSGRKPEREREGHFIPGLEDLLELAIAGKTSERGASYRGLGKQFETGYVALVQGEAARAVRHLKLAARETPLSFTVRLELGRALSMAGEMEQAREELETGLKLCPGDLEGVNLLAAVLIELGRYTDAVRILQPHAEQDGALPETHFLLGRSLAELGRSERAMGRFRKTVEVEPRFAGAYFEGARLLRESGDSEGAFELLSRASAILPEEVTFNRELAQLVLEQNLDVEAGLAACDRLMVTDEENNWEYLSWIAQLYLRRGWRREARDPLRKALALIPRQRTGERLKLEQRLREIEEEKA